MGFEGLVSKRRDQPYRGGGRAFYNAAGKATKGEIAAGACEPTRRCWVWNAAN